MQYANSRVEVEVEVEVTEETRRLEAGNYTHRESESEKRREEKRRDKRAELLRCTRCGVALYHTVAQ